VPTTIAVAVPLSTLVPRKQMFLSSSGDVVAIARARRTFSTGIDSPVRLAWMMNRSLQDRMRTSAGIMSPAARRTISPGTSSASAISRSLAVANHRRGDADHGLQLGRRGVGARLLNETQSHAQNDHQQHHDGGAQIARGRRQHGQQRQQDDQRVEHRHQEQIRASCGLPLARRHSGRAFPGAARLPPGKGRSPSVACG
jgi:hypothetical protein